MTEGGVRAAFDLIGDVIGAPGTPGPVVVEGGTETLKPKSRIPATLPDAIIVAPAEDLKYVKPNTLGSKRHLIAYALERGATLDD